MIAGGELVSTIRSGIIDPGVLDPDSFVWLMMSALLAWAVWLNFATAVGAPVSTAHSIVGAILGAGIAAAWVITVPASALFAAMIYYMIRGMFI